MLSNINEILAISQDLEKHITIKDNQCFLSQSGFDTVYFDHIPKNITVKAFEDSKKYKTEFEAAAVANFKRIASSKIDHL